MKFQTTGADLFTLSMCDLSPRLFRRGFRPYQSRTARSGGNSGAFLPTLTLVRDVTEEVFVKSNLWLLALAAGLVLVSTGTASGQCRSGGGGQAASVGTAAVSTSGSGVVASGQLLTSPGSWYHDVMMQQQLQQAMARQQYAMAVAKAQKAQAKYEVRLANAQKRRSEAAYKLEADRARRSLALAQR